jgi:hypothetical protein
MMFIVNIDNIKGKALTRKSASQGLVVCCLKYKSYLVGSSILLLLIVFVLVGLAQIVTRF